MSRIKTLSTVLALAAGLVLGAGLAASPSADAAKPKKKPVATAPMKITAEHKKALTELMGEFKFGMEKDAIVGILTKQLDERYAEQIAGTSDIYTQDKLRKEKKEELARVTKSYVEFQGTKTGWDVSIIDSEFGHKNDESMLVYWENQGGKNQRRFFFFHEGKLYKMFIALDTKPFAEDQRNFDFFRGLMEGRFGKGKEETGKITWRTEAFEVKAIDKIQFYDTFGLVIADARVQAAVVQARADKAEPKATDNNILKSVTEKGADDKPSLDDNKDVLKDVIKDQKKK